MNKRIASLLISAVLIIIAVGALNNPAIVDACDNAVLLEKRHPGYWKYLRNNRLLFDSNADGENDVTVYRLSKSFLQNTITSDDYTIFLRDSVNDANRRIIYFYDGTGIDVNESSYGKIDTDSWIVTDGVALSDVNDIRCKKKSINEITDIYEYLNALKSYSFIISAMDDAGNYWNEDLENILGMYGLKGGFRLRDSYIAVVENGKAIYEKVSHETIDYSGAIDGKELYVKSAGYDTEKIDSIISVNGEDYSAKGRGLNIVVLKDGVVIDSVDFDTWSKLLPCIRY